ncbi:hypothetical protein [Actinomycetospora sp. TBRC 11914]|uniref:hypothetical protein n=1 Tax=Actinomycetospora sp. TBRC 11914 TaxID=2729387 RepID=UPI00145F3367|nr:hypothetical protein [Actinomycetospora sp. TBRC 11914]NMO93208.1 hypothetical protein [Actinomycetospora sp. TBRC 11914]
MNEEDEDEVPALLRYFAAGINGLTGKAVEGFLLVQGADPMVAAMTGGSVGEMAKETILEGGRRLLLRRQERLLHAFTAAEEESGGWKPHELFARALDQDDERRLDLFVNAFNAAAREADEYRVRSFGRLAAMGVLAEEDAVVDQTARVFATLASFDRADLRAMVYMAERPNKSWQRTRYPKNEGTPNVLDEELPDLAPVLDAVLARLEGAGVITSAQGPGLSSRATQWQVTTYGELCARELARGDDTATYLPS